MKKSPLNSVFKDPKKRKVTTEGDKQARQEKKKARIAEEEKDLEERRKENTRSLRFLEEGKFIKLYDITKDDKHYIIEVIHTMFYCTLTSFCAA